MKDIDFVEFDPGLANYVEDFSGYAGRFYESFNSLKSFSQKSAKFKMFAKSLESKCENNIAFYAGCLLWAMLLKGSNPSKRIENNPFLNIVDELPENFNYAFTIEFTEKFFDIFERDYKYYTGKSYKIPELWRKILELYKEFLILNKGFYKTATTDDLKLPEKLSGIRPGLDSENLLKVVLDSGDLLPLLELPFFI